MQVPSGPLDAAFLARLAGAAQRNPDYRSRATGLYLTIGFRDSATGASGWLRLAEGDVTSGSGESDARFVLQADSAAWQELIAGMPINRLLRQGKVQILGDARACIQNWLVVFALASAAPVKAG